jgi:hypothetical protein
MGKATTPSFATKNIHNFLETIQASTFDDDSPLVVKLLNGQKVAYVVGNLPIFTSTKC